MTPRRVGEVCLLTRDVPRLAGFYRALLGVPDSGDKDPVHQTILREETSLTIFDDGCEHDSAAGSICLAFTVEDVDRAAELVRKLGGHVLEEPCDRPWGARNMSFLDPDGNTIYLRSFLRAAR